MKHIDKTVYFETEGNTNFEHVIEAVHNYIDQDDSIKNIVVFAGKTSSVFRLQESLLNNNKQHINITVATYAFGRKFIRSNNEEPEAVVPEASTKEAKEQILASGMNYIQGGLPFEPILSCTGDNSTEMIISAYGTISRGLPHCISAAVMAYENGILEENEKIIALSGDTAILVTPTIRREIFSGDFRIHKIICKPL